MPKKGKGRKGKGKTDGSETGVQSKVEEPVPSSAQAGRGRGRGISVQRPVEAPGAQEQKTAKDSKEKPFFAGAEVADVEQHRAPKGRGRGRGSPTQASVPVSPGIQEQRKEPKEDFPELSGATAKRMEDTSTKKKVLSEQEQDKLLSQVAKLKLEHKTPTAKHLRFAAKPSRLPLIDATDRISLYVNYFRLQYKDNYIIYHYDVDISDSTKDNKIGESVLSKGRTAKEDKKKNVKYVERQKRRNMGKAKCRQIISKVFEDTPILKQYCPVYDGQKNLFTSKPLPCKKEPFPVNVIIEDKAKNFFVKITPVEKEDGTNKISIESLKYLYECFKKKIPMQDIPNEVLLVYNTIMCHRKPPFQQVQFRNSFFSLTERKDPLGCGLEIWFGYHQDVQLTELGPVVVINLAAKAFHKAGSVIDYANDVLQVDDIRKLPKLQGWQISSLTDALRGLQIKVNHQKQPRKYKIKEVMNKAPKDIMIDYEKRKISVVQYFFEKYNKKLLYPHLPCLQMQTSTNTTYIPMETCEIIQGQPKIGKLSADLTSKMIRSTAIPPARRMDSVSKLASTVNTISKNYMNAFGLLMDIKLLKVDGRIIAAPKLCYAESPNKSHIVKPDIKGVWRVEDGKKFYKHVIINKWVLISFADERRFGHDILSKYCEFLCKSARKCGMQLDRPQSIDICRKEITTEQALMRAKKSEAQFAIVVLNRRDYKHTYDEVKFLADFKYNLVTQCMEDKTLSRINDQITTNVCLKINVKLGGINHILFQKPQIFSKPVIVFGVDAIHWARGYGYPSIVSVVGSLNPSASRYALTCDLQRNEKEDKLSQEIIKNMQGLAKEVLKAFQDANKGMHPLNIVVFRDGVSEGQFQHALDYEVSGIQQACMDLFQKYIPITFIVVQKRHHTRFFPVNPSQGIGRNQNVPPGTCVDRDITHPVFFDYFICSHEGIQGTSKPAHYTVLHNDNNFQFEELEQLCYFLCHTYVRCTRSVSLPAPVMYADLAATRAKKYADLHIGSDNISVSSDVQKDLPPDVERAIRSMKSFENNMFYV